MRVLVREPIAEAGIELLRGRFEVDLYTETPLEENVARIWRCKAGNNHERCRLAGARRTE